MKDRRNDPLLILAMLIAVRVLRRDARAKLFYDTVDSMLMNPQWRKKYSRTEAARSRRKRAAGQ